MDSSSEVLLKRCRIRFWDRTYEESCTGDAETDVKCSCHNRSIKVKVVQRSGLATDDDVSS